MTLLIGILVFALLVIVLIQIARITEVTRSLRGDEDWKWVNSIRTANWLLAFGIFLLISTAWSGWHYKNYMMVVGSHISSLVHFNDVGRVWYLILFFTVIVISFCLYVFFFCYLYII